MARVLLVEDGRFFARLLSGRIRKELGLPVVLAASRAELLALLDAEHRRDPFTLALLDLRLPDAPSGEVVDDALQRSIPSVVFSGEFSEEIRDFVWSKGVIDYVIKEGPHNVDYVVALVRRIHRNRDVKVLVAEDSSVYRRHVVRLLTAYQLQVLEAADGNEALAVLEAHPDVRLALLDYNMPGLNGFQLANRIPQRWPKGELALVGMSASGDSNMSARFIKNGASDFISKPFTAEELYCRVTQGLELLEHIAALRSASRRDFLTELPNRRHFFEVGRPRFARAREQGVPVSVAMLDLDHFKKVNDTYGHDAGDDVLREVSRVLAGALGEGDLLARFGGEEFCVLLVGSTPEQASRLLEGLRARVEALRFEAGGRSFGATASGGLCCSGVAELDAMITQADALLYEAKRSGRNRVVSG